MCEIIGHAWARRGRVDHRAYVVRLDREAGRPDRPASTPLFPWASTDGPLRPWAGRPADDLRVAGHREACHLEVYRRMVCRRAADRREVDRRCRACRSVPDHRTDDLRVAGHRAACHHEVYRRMVCPRAVCRRTAGRRAVFRHG